MPCWRTTTASAAGTSAGCRGPRRTDRVLPGGSRLTRGSARPYTAAMRLGIDFGTTHTVVAMADQGSYPVVSFEAAEAVPSLVAVRDADGAVRFGSSAQAAATRPGWR